MAFVVHQARGLYICLGADEYRARDRMLMYDVWCISGGEWRMRKAKCLLLGDDPVVPSLIFKLLFFERPQNVNRLHTMLVFRIFKRIPYPSTQDYIAVARNNTS